MLNKKLTLFYLDDCPYCHSAHRALADLKAETPAYRSIEVEWIEESQQVELASKYDYYYVPSIFAGDRKLYEAAPSEGYSSIKKNIKAALEAVLRQ